jgi:hypothetical protein
VASSFFVGLYRAHVVPGLGLNFVVSFIAVTLKRIVASLSSTRLMADPRGWAGGADYRRQRGGDAGFSVKVTPSIRRSLKSPVVGITSPTLWTQVESHPYLKKKTCIVGTYEAESCAMLNFERVIG